MSFKHLEEETSFCSKSLNFNAWPNLKIWLCFNWLFTINGNQNIKKQPLPQTTGDQKFWKLSGIIFENWNISNKFENWMEFERISKAIFSIFKKACIFTELLGYFLDNDYLLIKTGKTVQDNFSLFVLGNPKA